MIYGFAEAADTEWVRRRMTPHPFAAFEHRNRWGGPVGNGVPKLYIDCTDPPIASLVEMKKRYRSEPGWELAEIKTGHDAMISAPDELARILLGFAAG